MVALVLLLTLVALSILITRIATKALTLTGLPVEAARFQARSVFTGTGFTTNESETVVNHPVRRRIIMVMMLAQSAGLVSVISMLVLAFVGTETTMALVWRGAILVGGIALLAYLAKNKYVERALERLIERLLEKYTDLHVTDYYMLLHLEGDYAVHQLRVEEDSWLADKTLDELALAEEGIIVLSINRDGEFHGAPDGGLKLKEGDKLTLYGSESGLKDLQERLKGKDGEEARLSAEARHRRTQEEEKGHFEET